MFFPIVMPSSNDWKYIEEMHRQERKRKIIKLAEQYSIQLLKDKYDINAVNQKAFEMAKQFYDFAESVGD